MIAVKKGRSKRGNPHPELGGLAVSKIPGHMSRIARLNNGIRYKILCGCFHEMKDHLKDGTCRRCKCKKAIATYKAPRT